MSEELCPSSADTPVPLPFFVRTANQVIAFPPTTKFLLFLETSGEPDRTRGGSGGNCLA